MTLPTKQDTMAQATSAQAMLDNTACSISLVKVTEHFQELRASDAERELIVGALNTSVKDGRIVVDEFQNRLQGVLSSKTVDQLQQLIADLPYRLVATTPEPAEVATIAPVLVAAVPTPAKTGNHHSISSI